MKSNHITYNVEESAKRIDEILSESDASFEEKKQIPSETALTYTNGVYVKCAALFVDIRDSSKLPEKHRRPTLAKLYRAYLSEITAVINANPACAQINLEGDCVWGVFNTPLKSDFDSVFATAARVNSLINILNHKLEKRGITPIRVGLGACWGRALMIKAGFAGSGLSDIVWMGDVVNEASKLCARANKDDSRAIMVSNDFRYNLNGHNQGLLAKNILLDCYHGDIIIREMEDWLKKERSRRPLLGTLLIKPKPLFMQGPPAGLIPTILGGGLSENAAPSGLGLPRALDPRSGSGSLASIPFPKSDPALAGQQTPDPSLALILDALAKIR